MTGQAHSLATPHSTPIRGWFRPRLSRLRRRHLAETLQLRLLPRPWKASPLSTAATVQATGPLTAPAVKIEKGSLATSSTAALLENVGGTARLRRAWHWLRGKQAEPTLCEKLLEPAG